jgi:hypothetical protein
MKKFIIASAITASFSTMENASFGLADRINEARIYPNKTVEKVDTRALNTHHKQMHLKMSNTELRDHLDSSK